MENERKLKLLETMKSFNKTQKNEVLSFGVEKEDLELLPTGIKMFDDFIGGGLKKGTFSVIWGGEKVGKSTLVLQAIANSQKQGKICCYIDLEHTFEKERAVKLGVNLDDLILAEKCANAEQALEIIRTFCKEKVVDLIVVDSIQAMSPLHEQENKGKERGLAEKEMAELARTLSKFFRVVAPDVFNAQASCIMIGQCRISLGSFIVRAELSGGESLKHFAYQRIFVRRGQKTDAPTRDFKDYYIDPDGKLRYSTVKDPVGFDSVIKLEKTKSSKSEKEGSEIHLPFIYDEGFVNEIKNSEDVEVRISGTNEEKVKIKAMLQEKGILPLDVSCETLPVKPELAQSDENQKNEEIPVLAEKVVQKSNEKKRGRPKKVDKSK